MKLRKSVLIFFILSAFVLSVGAADKTGETVKRQVISSGGNGTTATGTHRLRGVLAQPIAGYGITTGHSLAHGFLRGLITAPCDCQPGDPNADSIINIFDATYLITYLYIEGPPPKPYRLCSGDPNQDCTCNIFDITFLINFLYRDGPPPATCEEWRTSCGQILTK
jgi:hypothetical protein